MSEIFPKKIFLLDCKHGMYLLVLAKSTPTPLLIPDRFMLAVYRAVSERSTLVPIL